MRPKTKQYPVDRTKLNHALWKRGKTVSVMCRENYYTHGWMSGQLHRGSLNENAMEILKGYGITEEEIRP